MASCQYIVAHHNVKCVADCRYIVAHHNVKRVADCQYIVAHHNVKRVAGCPYTITYVTLLGLFRGLPVKTISFAGMEEDGQLWKLSLGLQ